MQTIPFFTVPNISEMPFPYEAIEKDIQKLRQLSQMAWEHMDYLRKTYAKMAPLEVTDAEQEQLLSLTKQMIEIWMKRFRYYEERQLQLIMVVTTYKAREDS